jgi:hypothetical protein
MAIGDGCVHGVPGVDRGAPQLARRRPATASVAALGERDQLLQDLDLRLALLRIADQHLDQFLEGQEPVGQLHVAMTDDLAPLPERAGVFVVGIEQEHVGGKLHHR